MSGLEGHICKGEESEKPNWRDSCMGSNVVHAAEKGVDFGTIYRSGQQLALHSWSIARYSLQKIPYSTDTGCACTVQ